MGYTAGCDGCGSTCRPAPALLCQFSPEFFRTSSLGGYLSDMGFDEGDTVTLCGDCTREVLE
ncbi:hypothetical protein GS429_08310 [Natronorubrum sp. JWXQ-INN-674]|uniref:Uncharacterized protein n=1 Tax=Natronorubrum halalkaliphilum TaxID=2691917 RepID=A0A6B0VMS2_9EURY|nr:hypothetical protein [Natronorubrum halalkaliphilum]MXV62062.1 hypothetical protein [Natronorubrum halalkaliphilum]